MGDVSYKTAAKTAKVFSGYRQNLNFYENLTLSKYEDFAKASGLADREDVLALLPYLSGVKSILEVGAGFGRAVDALLCFCPEAKITALEVCPHMCHFLQRRYLNDFNIHVMQADFLGSFLPHHHFDLVTLFWSTLTSFSVEEQQRCFYRIFNLLTKDGRAVIDLFESSASKEHQGLKDSEPGTKIWTTKVMGRQVFGWLPQEKHLIEMAEEVGLKLEDRLSYQAHQVQRRFLVFKRKV